MINSYLFEGYKAVATLYNIGKVGVETLIVNTQHTPVFGLPNGIKDTKESRTFLICEALTERELGKLIKGMKDCVIVHISNPYDLASVKSALKKLFPNAKFQDI
jgi:hypothetical protein